MTPGVGATATSPHGGTSRGGGTSAPPASNPPHRTGPLATPAPGVVQQPAAEVRRTPTLPVPARVGLVLLVILICGGLAAVSAPALPLLGAALRRRARKEVTPTGL